MIQDHQPSLWDAPEITSDAKLIELDLDSLELQHLAVEIEGFFSISMKDDEYAACVTVHDLAVLIEGKTMGEIPRWRNP